MRSTLAVAFLTIVLTLPVHARPKAEDVVAAPDPAPKAVLADVPFTGLDQQRIFVDLAKSGSRSFKLMLDTGASFSVLTPGEARSLGVNVRPHKSSPYRRATLLDRDLQFWVDTTSSDTGGSAFSYGLLGANFLEEYIVELDFVNERVRFIDRREYRLPKSVSAENEWVGRIQVISGRPHVFIERNGVKMSALFDTGAPPALILTQSSREELGYREDQLTPGGRVWGVLGPTEAFALQADGLVISGVDSGTLPATVRAGDYNQGDNTGAIVGLDWMKQFTVRIDYRRSRMWLRREIPTAAFEWYDWLADIQAWEAGRDDPENIPDPDPEPTEAEIEALREDAEASDQAQLERWKRDRDSAVYVEENGGWVRVDGYRLRNGPKEGEDWYSFEEMQALKQERAAQEDDAL